MPTPDGVPVKITSPGSRGSTADSSTTRLVTSNTMSPVRASWTVSPSTEQPRARSSGSSSSSVVTSQGPIGPNPGYDFPNENCAPAANWRPRSERSCPIVTPATWFHASAAATRSARSPITTTSSTSQSTIPSGRATEANGPTRHVGNLVNVAGLAGSCRACLLRVGLVVEPYAEHLQRPRRRRAEARLVDRDRLGISELRCGRDERGPVVVDRGEVGPEAAVGRPGDVDPAPVVDDRCPPVDVGQLHGWVPFLALYVSSAAVGKAATTGLASSPSTFRRRRSAKPPPPPSLGLASSPSSARPRS